MPTFQDLRVGDCFTLNDQLYKKTGPGKRNPVYMQLIGMHGCRIVVGDSEDVVDVQIEVQLLPTTAAVS